MSSRNNYNFFLPLIPLRIRSWKIAVITLICPLLEQLFFFAKNTHIKFSHTRFVSETTMIQKELWSTYVWVKYILFRPFNLSESFVGNFVWIIPLIFECTATFHCRHYCATHSWMKYDVWQRLSVSALHWKIL